MPVTLRRWNWNGMKFFWGGGVGIVRRIIIIIIFFWGGVGRDCEEK